MSTPGPGGPQPPEQDPSQSGQPAGWGQQPPAGQPYPGQQPQQPWGAPAAGQPGAPQQPWGAPPAGPPQQPWGAPPAGGAQAFGQPQQAQKPKRRWLPIVIGVVALIVVLGALNSFFGGNSAKAGDCVNSATDEIGVVDCDSKDAAYKVAGLVDDVSQNQLENDPTLCTTKWPNSVAYAWEGTKPKDLDAKGTGYCLEDLPQ